MSRARSRMALALAVTALGGAVVVHHTPVGMHDGMPRMSGVVVCLAVLGVTLLVAAAIVALPHAGLRHVVAIGLRALAVPAARGAPARAGPLYLRLQVLRR